MLTIKQHEGVVTKKSSERFGSEERKKHLAFQAIN